MEVVRDIAALQRTLGAVRASGQRIGLVPTMGHLHAGHDSLVARAHELADHVVASIFVNPTQFGEGEDYSSYPRTPEADARRLEAAGTHLLFAPEVSELYPQGSEGTTQVEVPHLSTILCGAHRPTHFVGVTTVVTILCNVVQPHVAVFGEKDFQQLLIIRRMVRDLHAPIVIAAAPTAREPDGLAMSSRNVYLTAEERARAPELYRVLCAARDRIAAGERDFAGIEAASLQRLGEAGFRPEYFSLRRSDDLAPANEEDANLILLAAAWLGRARLIDNVSLR